MKRNGFVRFLCITCTLITAALVSRGIGSGTAVSRAETAAASGLWHARFAYVINQGSRDISMFRIDPLSGALTSIGQVPAGGIPQDLVAIPRDDSFYLGPRPVYVVNRESDGIAVFMADAFTGLLKPSGRVATGFEPAAMAVDPSTQFLMVANEGSDDVSVFRINRGTGGLEPTATLPAGDRPIAVAFHPGGTMAYVLNQGSGTISTYQVDRWRGVVTPLSIVTPAGDAPTSMAILPSGAAALVANPATRSISLFLIPYQPLPLLVRLGEVPVDGGPAAVFVDSAGNILITIPELNVMALFRISPLGTITFGGLTEAGSGPSGVVIDTNGVVYVTNRDSNDISIFTMSWGSLPVSIGRVGTGSSPELIALMF